MKSRRAELALAGVTVIWGATFVLVKSALADVSTLLFLALRFTLAAIVLVAVYGRQGSGEEQASFARPDRLKPIPPAVRASPLLWVARGLRPGLLAGALLFVAYVFQTAGLKLTTPSKSAFLTGLSIPLVPLASSLVYRARPRLFEVAGVLVATAGMALLTLPPGGFAMSRGDFLSFLCAVTFALHIVVVSHYSPIIGFEAVAVVQIVAAAALGLAATGGAAVSSIEPLRFHATPQLAVAVLVTGLLATALAFTTMAWAQQYTSATRAALIFALEPVVAWLASYWLTGEIMPFRGKVGTGLILAGVLVVELRGATRKPGEVVTNVITGTSRS
jgi:drug/metabolite transporter (DMT)-like permease